MSWAGVLAELLLPGLKVCALVVSLAGVALGIALIARSKPTLRVLHGLNRWVSTRRVLKPLEIPRTAWTGNRFVVGAVLAAIGLYAIVVLAPPSVAARLALALGLDPRYSPAAIAIDAARWLLVAGSALAAGVGVLMLLAPRAYAAFEARSNRWISTRRLVSGADTMYLPLEHLAEAFPRATGVVLAGLSAAAAAACVVLLLPRN